MIERFIFLLSNEISFAIFSRDSDNNPVSESRARAAATVRCTIGNSRCFLLSGASVAYVYDNVNMYVIMIFRSKFNVTLHD